MCSALPTAGAEMRKGHALSGTQLPLRRWGWLSLPCTTAPEGSESPTLVAAANIPTINEGTRLGFAPVGGNSSPPAWCSQPESERAGRTERRGTALGRARRCAPGDVEKRRGWRRGWTPRARLTLVLPSQCPQTVHRYASVRQTWAMKRPLIKSP